MNSGYVTTVIPVSDEIQVGYVSDDNKPGVLYFFVQFLAANSAVAAGDHVKYNLKDAKDVDYETELAEGEQVAVDLEDD